MGRQTKTPRHKLGLEKLKKARASGESGIKGYNDEESPMFQEVDDAEYDQIMRKRFEEDDFVVDDDGRGYAEYGVDDEGPMLSEDEYEDEPVAKDSKGKKAARKARPQARVTAFFSKQVSKTAKPPLESKVQDNPQLLDDVLADIEAEAQVHPEPPAISQFHNLESDMDDQFTQEPAPTDTASSGAMTKVLSSAGDMDNSTEPTPLESNAAEVTAPPVEVSVRKLVSRENIAKVSSAIPKFEITSTIPEYATSIPISQHNGSGISEDDGSIRMFWFDAYEKDGVVFLIGKIREKETGRFSSCCVQVKNIQRNLYFIPKRRTGPDGTAETVPINEVYTEVSELRKKFKINQFLSKKVTRKYAFELTDIPAEFECLKVVYSYQEPEFPSDINAKTFGHVFGASTSALETFVIKRRLMGPCWLSITEVCESTRFVSWARREFSVEDPKAIKILTDESAKESPPFSIMSLSFRNVVNYAKKTNEIVAVSAHFIDNVSIEGKQTTQQRTSFTALRQLEDVPFPVGFQSKVIQQRSSTNYFELLKTERALFNYLLAIIHKYDPDILVGHNLLGVDLGLILHRMKALKVDNWSKLGRLRRSQWPKLSSTIGSGDAMFHERQILSGRILCDTFSAAKEYVLKAKSYTLSNLALTQLGFAREEVEVERIPKMFWDIDQLLWLATHNEKDCRIISDLMFKLQVLPLTKQLTNLAGNLWSRTILAGSRADRNEYLLLHEFHNKKYIVPDKAKRQTKVISDMNDDDDDEHEQKPSSSRKPAYAGGLVLEPKKGFYDNFVVMLDFNSLYPSIIQEFNICFTTVERTATTAEGECAAVPPEPNVPQGILPRLLATLVERRRAVKALMKDSNRSPSEMAELDVRQQALKLTANSMYGCLGFTHSRFYAKPLAMLVTQKGRETLQSTLDLATSEKLEVIYGDTDSIMIHTNSSSLQEVIKIGNEFKKSVNKRYRLLEIEIDGVFKKMLLLKKKKYAALPMSQKDGRILPLEKKGLDIVRRDWCNLSHEVSEFVLKEIFSDKSVEDLLESIYGYLRQIGEDVQKGICPIDKFVINKGLTKNPEDYADTKNLPHVQVALALRAKGVFVRSGDTVPYVIVKSESTSLGARARHPDELKQDSSSFELDFNYYLSNQILPPVLRLLEPISGCEPSEVAHSLGITLNLPTKRDENDASEQFYTLSSTISDEERFKDVIRWMVQCPSCQIKNEFSLAHITKDIDDVEIILSGSECSNLNCRMPYDIDFLERDLLKNIRQAISLYLKGVSVCEEASCQTLSTCRGIYGGRCQMPGCKGRLILRNNHKSLETQLLYFLHLFDVQTVVKKLKQNQNDALVIAEATKKKFRTLVEVAELMISRNARRFVEIGNLFDTIFIKYSK